MTKLGIIITATTFPRWKDDSVPDFVYQFSKHILQDRRVHEVGVLAPHAHGAATCEDMGGVRVYRYRYFIPDTQENISYGGGVGKIRKSPLYAIKLSLFLAAQTICLIFLSLRKREQMINAHWLVPQGFIAVVVGRMARKPVLITVHGGDVFSLKGRTMTSVKRWSLKNADAVVVNSSATLAAVKAIYPDRHYYVIPMGIDEAMFPEIRKKYNNKKLKMLFVGRLAEEKGLIYALKAMSILEKSLGRERVQLTIAGTGPEENVLKDYVKKNSLESMVTFKGWVKQDVLPELHKNADIFIGPSIISDNGWQEAFGLVFAESLAMGTPVIATSTGGISDIVEDGVNGFLVEQKSEQALADAIMRFIDDNKLAQNMGSKSRDYILEKFSWDKIVDRYGSVIGSLK